MISKIRESLTARIFLLMCLLLLAVSAITYGAVASFLPAFYSSQLEEGLAVMSQEMADTISTHATIEEAAGAIELFEASAQVTVVILDRNGNTVWPAYVSETATMEAEAVEEDCERHGHDGSGVPEEKEAGTAEDVSGAEGAPEEKEAGTAEDVSGAEGVPEAEGTWSAEDAPGITVSEDGEEVSDITVSRGGVSEITDLWSGVLVQQYAGNFAKADQEVVSVQVQDAMSVDYGYGSAMKHFDIEVGKEPYTMLVMGGMQPVDQAMGILKEIFPYIIGIAAALAVLFAAAGSFYLTAPTVRLSRISRKMAVLDFSDTYQGKRRDELGVLGRNLNEMAASLSAALKELQTANAKLRTDIEQERELERRRIAFFSAVSHELKTPVTILKGHLSGMLQGVGAYQDHTRYLQRSLETADSMEHMVQELLTVARMENGTLSSGERAARFDRMDLSETLREELAALTELAEEQGLAFEVDIPEHLYAEANAGMMEKVFCNLLVNAIRYTPPAKGNEVRVRLWREAAFAESSICFSVENTGVFIPEESLPHLFEAFYRAEGSRSRKTGGSGLGLYIVRMALEQHGAQYEVCNTQEGVCVSFCMPQVQTT